MKRMTYLFLLLFGIDTSADAKAGIGLLEPLDIHADIYQYDGSVLDDKGKDMGLGYGGSFVSDFNIIRYYSISLYSNNNLYFDQRRDNRQINNGGYKWEVGAAFKFTKTTGVEFFKQNNSKIFKGESGDQYYPSYVRYGIRFNLYK